MPLHGHAMMHRLIIVQYGQSINTQIPGLHRQTFRTRKDPTCHVGSSVWNPRRSHCQLPSRCRALASCVLTFSVLELPLEEDSNDNRLSDGDNDDHDHFPERVMRDPSRCALDGLTVSDLPELEVPDLTAQTAAALRIRQQGRIDPTIHLANDRHAWLLKWYQGVCTD